MARAREDAARIMKAALDCCERAGPEGLGGEDCNAVCDVIEWTKRSG